jgi:hypothetical protein
MAFLDEPIKSEIRYHPAALYSYRILHDIHLDAEMLYFRCHLMTHIAYLANYVKEAKDPSFPDCWMSHADPLRHWSLE